MMKEIKKYSIYFVRYMMVVFIFVTMLFISPSDVSAASEATTLAELRQELAQLKAKKSKYDNEKAMSESEKRNKNNEIRQANEEITQSENKISEAKVEIENIGKRISELDAQTKELMTFYQQIISNNSYLEFISDSSSMTELVMRMDAVVQVTNFNKKKLTEMEDLIKENEQKQVDLLKYEKELNEKIANNEKKISELDSSILALADLSMDINEEIKIVETSIKQYKDMGCGENQKFSECANYSYNSTWLKPVVKGSVNSLFGWRVLNGKSSYHSGIDIGVAEKTTVYSATNGVVKYIINKSSCGGNQVYVESKVNGVTYTMLYAHLYSINVKVGQTLTTQSVIGLSGGYSTSKSHGGYDTCTFGAHLHYSVSKSNWTTWSHFYNNLINPPGFPKKGAWFYNRNQWFG